MIKFIYCIYELSIGALFFLLIGSIIVFICLLYSYLNINIITRHKNVVAVVKGLISMTVNLNYNSSIFIK